MQVGTILLIMLALIVAFIIFEFLRKKPHQAMAVYYAGMFLKRFIFPTTRVRESVVIQIALFLICLFLASIGYANNRAKKSLKPSRIPVMEKGFLVIGTVVFIELINGFFFGYGLFAMMVDVYKVLEIFLYYFCFTRMWRTKKDMEEAVSVLTIEMCIFGTIEMFLTERGGVGLNMIMCFAPIIFALGFYTKQKRFWVVIVCSLIVVLVSKTRTYLFGFVLSILLTFLFANGRNKKKIAYIGLILLIVGTLFIVVYSRMANSELLSTIFERFLELASGFEEAGGYRIYEIRTAWRKFLEDPLLGKGYGYLEYVYIETQGTILWGDFMHNVYMEILVKTGIFGVLFYGIGLIAYCVKQHKKIATSRHIKNKETGYLIGGLTGTYSWLFIYIAAPLSSFGYVFIPGMVGMLYSWLCQKEETSKMLDGEKTEII